MQAIQLTCAARPARIAALCGRRLPVSATRLQQQYRQCSRRIRSWEACVVRASEVRPACMCALTCALLGAALDAPLPMSCRTRPPPRIPAPMRATRA